MVMRVSTSTFFQSNLTNLTQQQTLLMKTQQQVASGKRILTPADDPVAAARALEITQSDALNTQYGLNRNSARHTLSLAETALQSVTTLIQDVQAAAVNAGNGTLNNSDRQTVATELSGRLQELIGLSNSTDGVGNFLFAGFQSKTQPFMNSANGVSYFGDDGQRLMQVSSSRQMSASNAGSDIFMRNKTGNGTFETSAVVTNTGTGTIGLGAVADSKAITGNSYTIAFDTWSAAAGAGATGQASIPTVTNAALVTGNPYEIRFDAAGANFDVFDTVTGLNVLTAQPYTSGSPIAFDGLQMNIQGAAGANAVYTVTPPVPGTYTITNDTTGLPVTGQVAQPFVTGQAINFDGMRIDINGKPAAGDQFKVTPSAHESLFKTLSDLVTVLNTPVTPGSTNGMTNLGNSLARGINNLGNALDSVLTVRSSLGLRLNEIDALQSAGDNLSLQYKQTLSQLQDVDYNKALSDLTQQQMNLQAAQKSFSQIANLSLFSYL